MGTQRRFRPSSRLALASSIAIATIVCLGLVYIHVVLAQRQFALDTTNAQITQSETIYQGLRLRVAELSSPANIISTAEGKLGMIQPSSVDYLTPSMADQPASVTTSKGAPGASSKPTAPTSMTPGADSNWPAVKSLIAGQP
jgi:cell division protein FtsL